LIYLYIYIYLFIVVGGQPEIQDTPLRNGENNPLLDVRQAETEDSSPNHFDIVRYVLCWTGVSTIFYNLGCKW